MNKQTADMAYPSTNWASEAPLVDQWDPGFDADRCLVFAKLGPYKRLYEKPEKFSQRFFHTLYPLNIEHWALTDELELFDGFCTVSVALNIRFQATFKYIQKNALNPDAINAHIKSTYEPLVHDIVQEELLMLHDGSWVQHGLGKQERQIATAINELLMAQEIQVQALCQLQPAFKAFPDIKFKEESIYLMALKKNFEISHQKQLEQFLQEQALAQLELEQKQKELEIQQRHKELELLAQKQQADYEKQVLLEQEAQQAERFIIEKRLQAEKEKHETELYGLALAESLRRQEQKEAMERELELNTLEQKLAHQLILKEHELANRIKAFELEKQQWHEAKMKLQAEEIKFRQQQKQMEIAAEFENKAYLHQQRLKLQEQVRSPKS